MKINRFFAAIAAVGLMCSACSNSTKTEAAGTDTVATEEATVAPAPESDEPVIELTPTSAITPTAEMPVVIDFSATWCGPCQQFKPIYLKVAADLAGKARFCSADVDQCTELAKKFEVQSIPNIVIVKADGTVAAKIGAMTEEEFLKFLSENGI